METITIIKENAVAAYNGASGEVKAALGKLFGNQVVSQNPIDLFKSYADVCEAAGINTGDLPYPIPTTKKQVSVNGAFKLETIFEEFNKRTGKSYDELWQPNYANSGQKKRYPWFEWVPSRSAFVYSSTSYTGTYAGLGARLCTENEAYAIYIGKQFETEWNEFLNPQI